MPEAMISVQQLRKTFRVPERGEGLAAALRDFAHRRYNSVEAVRGIDFTIQPGEMVGFIGPNGAGKTTTLKMLSGLLYPSAGKLAWPDLFRGSANPAFCARSAWCWATKAR